MLTEPDIGVATGYDGPELYVSFTLEAAGARAISDALTFYQRLRFAGRELDTDQAIQLPKVMRLVDRFTDLCGQGPEVTVRMSGPELRLVAEAIDLYRSERDGEEYQSPEERERLASLGRLSEPMRDIVCDVRRAQRTLDERPLPDPVAGTA